MEARRVQGLAAQFQAATEGSGLRLPSRVAEGLPC